MSRILLLLALAMFNTGCRTRYELTLSNSTRIDATTKPKLDAQGYYVFKDAQGREMRISRGRVREIEAKR